MKGLTLAQLVEEYKPAIDQEIAAEFERRLIEVKEISPELETVVKAMRELSLSGKRLRGLLTILGYRLAEKGEVTAQIVKAACAMEIFHLGLLIQDDVMDRDELRRGVKTIHTRYRDLHLGESIATIAGDYTFGWCSEILSELKLPPKRVLEGMRIWGKYFSRVGYGQTLDMFALADEATIMQILAIKSGEYSCVLPLKLGAALGGGEVALQTILERYGMELGLVFQLRDDYLGMYGDPAKTGKPVGNDAREGKHTYATMHSQEETEAAIRDHLNQGLKLSADLPGDSGKVMEELLKWMATREN